MRVAPFPSLGLFDNLPRILLLLSLSWRRWSVQKLTPSVRPPPGRGGHGNQLMYGPPPGRGGHFMLPFLHL